MGIEPMPFNYPHKLKTKTEITKYRTRGLVVRASVQFPGRVRPKDFKSWYSQLPCL